MSLGKVIFHIDVNSAFLSWEAVYRLHHLGWKGDLGFHKEPDTVSVKFQVERIPGFSLKWRAIHKGCFLVHICYSSTHHFRYGFWYKNQMVNGIFCFKNDTVLRYFQNR